MFVRWMRSRRWERGKYKGEYGVTDRFGKTWYYREFESIPLDKWVRRAVLVESVRTESGPRHKFVCYLGSIHEGSRTDAGLG
jgi:hypothetical protein